MLISKNHRKWVISKNHSSGMVLSPPCPFPQDQCQAGAWQLTALLEWLQAPGRRGSTPIPTHGRYWPPQTPPGHLPAETLLSVSCSPALRPTTCHDMPWCNGALLPLPASQMLTRAGPWGGTAWDSPLHKGQGRCSHLNLRRGRTALTHNYSLNFCSMRAPLGQGFTAMQSVLITPYEFYSSSMWDLCSAIKWRNVISGTRNLKWMLWTGSLHYLLLPLTAPASAVRAASCSKNGCMVFSETLRDFKLKTKDMAPLQSIIPNRAGYWQPGSRTDQSPLCLAVQREEAGLLHRCEQREPEQQGRGMVPIPTPSLPSQCVSHSAAVFSGINIPETPKCQWQA